MTLSQQAQPDLSSVQAGLNFLMTSDEKPKIYIGAPEEGIPDRTGEFQQKPVAIIDGRPLVDSLSLDREGFELHSHSTAMTDFFDDEEIRNVCYLEIVDFLKTVTGATRVHIFDHTVRVEADSKRDEKTVRAPVQVVHNDYTTRSGPQRIRDLLEPDEAEVFLRHRFSEINVWRSITETPVQTTPIAVADARSIREQDFIASDLVYGDRVGEIYQLLFDAKQQWYYFPQMTRDEVLLLKCYDSATDGRARFTAHSAFADPTAAANAPPRESIEVRTLLSFAPDFAE